MIRLLVRSLGLVLVVAAMAAVVADAARSIAASSVSLNEIGPTWRAINPASFQGFTDAVHTQLEPNPGNWVWDPVITWLLGLPASLVLTLLGFLLVLLGAPRRRRRRALA
jgi:hypothetical protein